jgi:Ser/Thr protein kinase RdoA (MazF antagonist)
MKKEVTDPVIKAFSGNGNEIRYHAEPLSGGLINHTYRVMSDHEPVFLLQQINTQVFPAPQDVQDNYMQVWQYAKANAPTFKLPAPVLTNDHQSLYKDNSSSYWRAFEYLRDTQALPVAETPAQAAETAITFAEFTATFSAMDVTVLKAVIPGFHDLGLRYRQFGEAIASGNTARMSKAEPLISALQSRERYVHFFEKVKSSNAYTLRVMHHDAKIANILFDKKGGQVVCPVDYDTVMPGYFFSDLGDMIRSMTPCADENSTDLETLCIRGDFYKAVLDGYLSVMDAQFTADEKKNIHYAGILMIYMQALRFLADYLNNDIYYRVDHPEHNYERALNQLTLLQKLESFLEQEYGFRA